MSFKYLQHSLTTTSNFFGIVTACPQMLSIINLIKKVSETESSVFIRGETGTGKELVAKAIHNLSLRKDKGFFALNCATLTPELMLSELFGHLKGAFTGAVQNRKGLFELSHEGTLFLDEVTEMPLEIQARLLRVLESHSFVPLGGTIPIHTNVRILAATNRSLRNEVAKGKFRADLMFRIRVVPIILPSLRERKPDIEILTWHFIDKFNTHSKRKIKSISVNALFALTEYNWPGNVRELRNNVEHAFAVGDGEVLQIDDLTPELRGENPTDNFQENFSHEKQLHQKERTGIIDALSSAKGRKDVASKTLGISRTTLWRKMKEFELT